MNNTYTIWASTGDAKNDKSLSFSKNSKGNVWIQLHDGHDSVGMELKLFEVKAMASLFKSLSNGKKNKGTRNA